MSDWPYPWISAKEKLRDRLDDGDTGDAMTNDGGIVYLLGDGAGEYMNMTDIPPRLENNP